MVGFPGETDDDFAHTMEVCEAVDFGHIHTFRYSPRAGTRAARLPGAVPEPVKAERSAAVRALAAAGRRRLAQHLTGHRQRVLVEQVDDSAASGYGESYVRIRVPATGHRPQPGEWYPVTVTGRLPRRPPRRPPGRPAGAAKSAIGSLTGYRVAGPNSRAATMPAQMRLRIGFLGVHVTE